MNRLAAPTWKQATAWALATALLLSVFAAYLQPDMAFALASWAWSCL